MLGFGEKSISGPYKGLPFQESYYKQNLIFFTRHPKESIAPQRVKSAVHFT